MALTDKLTAIADGFRTSRGTEDKYTLDQMAVLAAEVVGSDPVIEPLSITSNGTYTATECDGYSPITVNVPQDGAPTAEDLTFTGDISHCFFQGRLTWVIRNYGNLITTKDITAASFAFANCSTLESIPFDINFKPNHYTDTDISSIFSACPELRSVPRILNLKVADMESAFNGMHNLRHIPEDYCDTWDWQKINGATSAYVGYANSMFSSCYSLRSFPEAFLQNFNPVLSNYYSLYRDGFSYCASLDEVTGLPVYTGSTWTSDAFTRIVTKCSRLKRLTFKLNPETNAPYAVQWKSQLIALDEYTGWGEANNVTIFSYNSGITEDKEVTDDASYQALKDDPDWFTRNVAYSRYNHDSAVETINSLPDASAYLATAGGTNTIRFKGEAGSATDGGAINTLTEAEIAVATEKGWTVTIR